jgi:phosphoglycolate phosphatase-like HAD superfamily hydrolase
MEAFGNYYTSLYLPVLGLDSTVEDLAALLHSARRDTDGIDEMCFAPMDPEAPAYAKLLAAIRQAGWIPFEYCCFSNWYLEVSGGYGDYLKSRTASLRSTIKRMNKKFAANGGAFEIVTNLERVSQGIQDYQQVYGRSWKQPEPYPEFIPGLIRLMAAKGNLRLGIARIADHPIAAQLWITSHDKSLIFKVAYDEEYSGYSPGTLLTNHLMEYVIDSDMVREVDFLTMSESITYSIR